MHEFRSRQVKHDEKIGHFLESPEETSIEMLLYGSEIVTLQKRYPEIIIEQGKLYRRDMKLYHCKVSKSAAL